MNEHEDTITMLKESLDHVSYDRDVPRPRPRRTGLKVGIAAVTVLALVMVITPGADLPAWATEGREPTAEEVERAKNVCRETLEIDRELPPVIIGEVRGQSAYFVMFDADSHVTCLLERITTNPVVTSGHHYEVHGDRDLIPMRGHITPMLSVVGVGEGWIDCDVASATWLEKQGKVSAEVARLEIRSELHGNFDALTRNGWFIAWWPGGGADAVVYDADGNHLETQNLVPWSGEDSCGPPE